MTIFKIVDVPQNMYRSEAAEIAANIVDVLLSNPGKAICIDLDGTDKDISVDGRDNSSDGLRPLL